ncbi:hypothetical protein ACWGPW_24185 [Paenibacillus chitinolyticus]
MANTLEKIAEHIEELDKEMVSLPYGATSAEMCHRHAVLMNAKSTALLALVQAEAGLMSEVEFNDSILEELE